MRLLLLKVSYLLEASAAASCGTTGKLSVTVKVNSLCSQIMGPGCLCCFRAGMSCLGHLSGFGFRYASLPEVMQEARKRGLRPWNMSCKMWRGLSPKPLSWTMYHDEQRQRDTDAGLKNFGVNE